MSQLQIKCLGVPHIRHAEQVVKLPTRKALALLVYLAVEGGIHSRDKLSALFWPEANDRRARGALRSTLNMLQTALRHPSNSTESTARSRLFASHMIAETDALGLDPAYGLELDVARVRSVWARVRAPQTAVPLGKHEQEEQIAQLQAAVACYAGDFLEGFSLDDAPDFDDWASMQRETWHRRMNLVFERLAQLQFEGGDPIGALETSARWITHYPLNEAAYRQQMQLYFACGDRAAALQAYALCRAVLAAELNAEPALETDALAERLQVESPPQPIAMVESAEVSPLLTEPTLVGRLAEHAELVAACRQARWGQTQAIVLEGEPGIGKTRLVRDFLRWASAQGNSVIEGRALETGARLPYHPLVAGLRHFMSPGSSGPAWRGELRGLLSDVWLAELSRLLPELRERFPDLPLPGPLPDTEARPRLFEAIARLGHVLVERVPLVFFVDDVHWADPDSLDAIHYAAQRWSERQSPILLVFTIRSDEFEPAGITPTGSNLADWLLALGRTMPVSRLRLDALRLEDTRHLVQTLLPGAACDDLADRLYADTGGHPLYLIETLKALSERGFLAVDQGVWTVTSPASFTAPAVHDVIQSRLNRLSPMARSLLIAAAVLGQGFDFDRLRSIGGAEEDAALRALDEIVSRRLLLESGGQYLFAHDKIREVSYEQAGEGRRQVFHRRALRVLESAGAAPAELALHALRAGKRDAAFRFSVAAGDQAMRVFATRDAIAHYEQAHQLAADAANDHADSIEVSVDMWAHLHAQLGRAYELTNLPERARTMYQAMRTLGQASNRAEIACLALNRLALLTVAAWVEMDEATKLLEEAWAAAERSGDLAALAETEGNLAQMAFYRWDPQAAFEHGDRARALAQELGRPEVHAQSLRAIAYTELVIGKHKLCETHAGQAKSLYAEQGNRAMEADCLCLIAMTRIHQGQPEAGIAAARTAQTISLEIENTWEQAFSHAYLAAGLRELGAYEQAITVAKEGEAIARAHGHRQMRLFNLVELGATWRALLNPDVADSVHTDALAITEQVWTPPNIIEMVYGEFCADWAWAGKWDKAAIFARRALATRDYRSLYSGFTRAHETHALLLDGEIDQAIADIQEFGKQIGDNARLHVTYLQCLALIDITRAGLLNRLTTLTHPVANRESPNTVPWPPRLSDEEQSGMRSAIDHLVEAAALAEEIGLPLEHWPIRAALGELFQVLGEHEQASLAFARASETILDLAKKILDDDLRARFLQAQTVRRILDRVDGR